MDVEQVEVEVEVEEDNRSTKEICSSLKEQTKKVIALFLECESQYRSFHKETLDAMDPIYEAKLVAMDPLKVWLNERSLAESLTFQEFFQAFLAEHKKEDRLDLSNRTVNLNADACKLIGYRSNRGPITVLDLIEKLSFLFE